MGIFSSSKRVYVSSVAYNMAGDENLRVNYLQALVTQSVLSGSKQGLGTDIIYGYLRGPSIRLRSFFNWAKNSGLYDEIGIPSGELNDSLTLEPAVVMPYLPVTAGWSVEVQSAFLTGGDWEYWAERRMVQNHPGDIEGAWSADYIEATKQIKLKLPDSSTDTFTPSSPNYSSKARYIYVYYSEQKSEGDPPVVTRSRLKMFIYRIGSGTVGLDALAPPKVTTPAEYYPFIPIRLDNKFLSETNLPTAYAQAAKAYKKFSGSKLTKLIEKIEDNENIDDIDFAYIIFGVSLNTKENASRRYIYTYLRQLMLTQQYDINAYNAWVDYNASRQAAASAWVAWVNNGMIGDPPAVAPNRAIPFNNIRIKASTEVGSRFDQELRWNTMVEVTGTGKAKPGAKKGQYWFEVLSELTYNNVTTALVGPENEPQVVSSDPTKVPRCKLYWQETNESYRVLEIYGLRYRNYIYDGKYIEIDCDEALEEEDESGFIVPLHNATFKSVSLVHGSQMATACAYLLFNCVQIVKVRWYQKGFFKVIFVIVIAIVSAVFTGGAGFGLLGTSLGIGTSMGFTGLTAAIVGSLANAMAALVLSTIIEKVAGQMGGILGAIFSTLVMFFTSSFINGFQSGFNFNWADLMKVDNLMKITDVLSNGYSQMVQQEAQSLYNQGIQVMDNFQSQSDRISELYTQNIGYGNTNFNPGMLVNSTNIFLESGDSFLTRTLMTGSDIARMSHDMLNDFADLTLTLPTVYT